MAYSTTITSKGQITLPAAFRHKMNLRPGQRITINIRGNVATFHAPADIDILREKTAAFLKQKKIQPLNDEELEAAINTAAAASAKERFEKGTK